jgi:hypothetical protein
MTNGSEDASVDGGLAQAGPRDCRQPAHQHGTPMDPAIVLDSQNSAEFLVRQRHRNDALPNVFCDEVREIVPAPAGFENFPEPITSLLNFLVRNRARELEDPVVRAWADLHNALSFGVAFREFRSSGFGAHGESLHRVPQPSTTMTQAYPCGTPRANCGTPCGTLVKGESAFETPEKHANP